MSPSSPNNEQPPDDILIVDDRDLFGQLSRLSWSCLFLDVADKIVKTLGREGAELYLRICQQIEAVQTGFGGAEEQEIARIFDEEYVQHSLDNYKVLFPKVGGSWITAQFLTAPTPLSFVEEGPWLDQATWKIFYDALTGSEDLSGIERYIDQALGVPSGTPWFNMPPPRWVDIRDKIGIYETLKAGIASWQLPYLDPVYDNAVDLIKPYAPEGIF